MFSFRCFSCGITFSEGLPPLEALTSDQAAVVGGVRDAEDRFALLEDTPFKGMSTYQFCSFCLTIIREFAPVFEDRTEDGHNWRFTRGTSEFRSSLYCPCGFTQDPPEDVDYHVFINRAGRLHQARMMYPKGDFSMAEELLFDGLNKEG